MFKLNFKKNYEHYKFFNNFYYKYFNMGNCSSLLDSISSCSDKRTDLKEKEITVENDLDYTKIPIKKKRKKKLNTIYENIQLNDF